MHLFCFFLFAVIFNDVCAQTCTSVAVPLVTINAPTFNQNISLLSADILTLGFDWGRTTTRSLVPVITTGTCLFPSIANPFQEANPCYSAFTFQTSFSSLVTAPACATTSVSIGNPASKVWRIPVTLAGNETFLDQRTNTQTRSLVYNLLIQLGYPDFVTASVTITPFAPVLLDAFIISQIYSTSSKTATIIFNTVVGYPFMLTTSTGFVTNIPSNQIVITNTELTGFSAVVANSIPSTAATGPGQQSFQTWVMTITPPSSACTFSGEYNVTGYAISCIPGVACPPINNNAASIKLVISSENFCAQTSAVVGVSTSLKVFQDATFTIPGGNFLVDDLPVQSAFFEMKVTSSAVNVRDLLINTITLSSTNGQNLLKVSGTPTTTVSVYANDLWVNGINGAFPVESEAGAARFRFDVISALFNIPQDSLGQVLVQVSARVYYVGAKKRSISSDKRALDELEEDLLESEEVFTEFLLQTEGDQKEVYSVPLGLMGPKGAVEEAPTRGLFNEMTFGITLVVLAVLVVGLLIVLIVVLARRRNKKDKKSVQYSATDNLDAEDSFNVNIEDESSISLDD